ncbi:hypothetical protein HanRHA438_Chr02g0055801 [Helianthus annuus]|nr:hypothetical protein HanIR_Chr02g0061481 [Helianthus annuus]KAJ0938973.1 hypothetical protein HanRHA438_Chr02g0055801 [Helianthus annuus]
MFNPFILNNLYISIPPIFTQNVLVIISPILQKILLSNKNKYLGASKIRNFRIHSRVNKWVIHPACSRVGELPYLAHHCTHWVVLRF